jgi:predicted ATPase
MDGKRLIEKIRLRNILSFGDKSEEIELLPLNVIVGQNASGKSNLIDVIKLLSDLPVLKGFVNFLSKNGGVSEWIWKGRNKEEDAFIETELFYSKQRIRFQFQFNKVGQRVQIISEKIENLETNEFFQRNDEIPLEDSYLVNSDKIKETPEIRVGLIMALLSCKFFTDLQTNRNSEIRKPQLSDALNYFLAKDGSNLALILDDLNYRGKKPEIIANLQKFYSRITDYLTTNSGGTIQLHLREEGLEKPISAMRLSDGTLRYLCLLAILCHPEPPPLICIEEPETGLHPDILPTIAELMIEASERTQLIVTTHSDILVSALSDVPEAVLVCEKDEDGTHFKRLDKDNLKEWLDEYSLGELWLKGEIGGTRW